jgi:hypothetical protein
MPAHTKKGAAREATARNYDVVADARMLRQERMVMPRWFALYMGVHYTRKGVAGGALCEGRQAPPLLSQAMLQYIIALCGSVTIAEVLKQRQRTLRVEQVKEIDVVGGVRKKFLASNVLRNALPSIGDADMGYKFFRTPESMSTWDEICFGLQQPRDVNDELALRGFRWQIMVDFGRVHVTEGVGSIAIPRRAISVLTDAVKPRKDLRLTKAFVDKVLAFRIQGRITDCGKMIRFEQTNTGVPAALGFDAALKSSYVKGTRFESHADFAVGDTVTLVKTYKAYEKFAVNQQGVIRMIAMHSFAVYFVELADEDAAISKLVVQAHKKERGLMPDQLPHHVACKWLHMKHSDVRPVRPYMRGDVSYEESEPNLSFDLTDLPESPLSFEPETPPGTLLYTHEELCAFKFADGFVVQF